MKKEGNMKLKRNNVKPTVLSIHTHEKRSSKYISMLFNAIAKHSLIQFYKVNVLNCIFITKFKCIFTTAFQMNICASIDSSDDILLFY